jgi:hypothetical protein
LQKISEIFKADTSRLPLYLFVGTLAVALFIIYRNHIYRLVTGHDHWKQFQGQTMEVTISWPQPVRADLNSKGKAAVVKVSFPLGQNPDGCEFVYGAALVYHKPWAPGGQAIRFDNPLRRYLLKFKYDLKNKRCESKDLFLLPSDKPERFVIQLIEVRYDKQTVLEEPVATGVEIRLDNRTLEPGVAFRDIQIPAEEPFRVREKTRVVEKFSTTLDPRDVEVMVLPRDSLLDFLLRELAARSERCQKQRICDRIRVAVAFTNDARMIQAFERAAAAGLPIDWIENIDNRNETELGPPATGTPVPVTVSPWKWLRGNPYLDPVGRLPMHTKFAVFGDDLVVSAGANYDFERWPTSRDLAVIYRNKDVAAIFSEVFTMIRTSLYYPIAVDLRDDFVLLFNADRPRGYSASNNKPYLAVTTEEGVESSAYGILFELLAQAEGQVSLAMSPISNSCARYRRQRCLYEEIRFRAVGGNVDVLVNDFFYEDEAKFAPLAALFPPNGTGLRRKAEWNGGGSAHHERAAILGDDRVSLGSANYAFPSSLNTMEIISEPKVIEAVRREFATHAEPFFVAPIEKAGGGRLDIETCRFIVEKNVLRKESHPMLRFDRDELVGELKRALQVDDVEPLWFRLAWEDAWQTVGVPDENIIEAVPLPAIVESPASYFCLKDVRSGRTAVVRGTALERSRAPKMQEGR